MKRSQKTLRIVVKVGSSVLTGGKASIIKENLSRIVRHIAGFIEGGYDVILVTSGAIASGLSVLGLKKRPTELSELQAAAAVGQNILMHNYIMEFDKYHLKCAQILLTKDDFRDRKKFLRNTLDTLQKHKVIAVINENDSVSVDEIKFGDNDILSAHVAVLAEADGLLILSDIGGLFEDFDPATKTGTLIEQVEKIDHKIERLACGTDNMSCVGGMSSKIEAAKISTREGIPVILANGLKEDLKVDFSPIGNAVRHRIDGTLFLAGKK